MSILFMKLIWKSQKINNNILLRIIGTKDFSINNNMIGLSLFSIFNNSFSNIYIYSQRYLFLGVAILHYHGIYIKMAIKMSYQQISHKL